MSSMPEGPSVWVVTINWNGLDDTLACLESLQRSRLGGTRLEVLVIDNNSHIDPTAPIASRFPAVRVVRAPRNLGFAGGCNEGSHIAIGGGADYVLLLNNDTLVDPDAVERLVAYAEAHANVAAVAPLICYADQPEVVWFAGARAVLSLGHFQHRFLNRPRSEVRHAPFTTDYLTGCCMLIPRSVVDKLGLFDDEFFAYFEDAEFCLRARAQGYDVACVPTAVIWHKESASTRRDLTEGTTSPLKHYLCARNRIVAVARHARPVEWLCFLLIGTPARVIFYLVAFSVRRRWRKLVALVRGVADGLRGRLDPPLA